MSQNNIMFDLETLGNTSRAPIVQIGAAKFTDEGEILSTYEGIVDLKSLEKYDFKIDFDTLAWWFSQEDAAIKKVFCSGSTTSLRQVLYEFLNWIGSHGDYVYWSHATFDPPILVNNLKTVGLPVSIPFRAYRDIRTLVHFTGPISVEREGIEHDALSDVLHQVKYVTKGLEIIKTI